MTRPGIETCVTIREVRRAVAGARRSGRSIGLVPTMGALHDGHLRLVEEARRTSDFVVVSIFVNPAQFGPSEDFRRYPRTLEADAALCARGGADLIFAPEVDEMYPRGPSTTFVEVPALSGRLEGVDAGAPLAVALNGTIAAVGQAYESVDGGARTALLVPPERFRDGTNSVVLYEVAESGGATALRRIPDG